MSGSTFFPEYDEVIEQAAEARRVIPPTLEYLITRFIHRFGYNATAQERMRPELEELIAFARKER